MSVQNESLEMKPVDMKPADPKPAERKPDAPELEYKTASQDSLSMFFAAIGGAVLGMLGTLLVLALINGGTLNFIHPERLAVIEANLTRVNDNVGAVSNNVDAVATQVSDIRSSLTVAAAQVDTVRSQLATQGSDVETMKSAVDTLAVTGQRFDALVLALDQALTSVKAVGDPTAAAATAESTTAATTAKAASAVPAVAGPTTISAPEVKPGNVAVIFYLDENSDAQLGDAEANVVGIQLIVKDTAGKTVGTYTSTDGGALVEGLKPGAYTFAVEDTAGHNFGDVTEITVTVPEDAKEGQIVYFPAQQ